jgi:hypothetical protein
MLRNRIVPVAAPWMARYYSFKSKKRTFYGAMLPHGLYCILGTRGRIAAGVGQPGREHSLIDANHSYEPEYKGAMEGPQPFSQGAVRRHGKYHRKIRFPERYIP